MSSDKDDNKDNYDDDDLGHLNAGAINVSDQINDIDHEGSGSDVFVRSKTTKLDKQKKKEKELFYLRC